MGDALHDTTVRARDDAAGAGAPAPAWSIEPPPAPPPGAELWSAPERTLLAALRSSASGLSDWEAARRLAALGPNVAAPRRRAGPLRLLAAQFTSPITLLLLAAAVLSLVVGETVDGTIILAILLVSALLGFWQEHRAAGAIDRLLALIRTTATVVRDGRAREVPTEAVVPGDVVRLVAGSSVPGDARLLEANSLFVDQAALTGESYPSDKSAGVMPADTPLAERANTVYLGTHVVSGAGVALVVRTGTATEFGAIAGRLAFRPPETEFEHGVRRFGYLLLDIAMALAIVIFAINVALHRPVLDALLFTLALTVGLTPQLLPAIVSVTLSQGARHMARERVIVRRLASIEDLGGMEILCADKTGTITEGMVAVRGAEDWTGAPSDRARLFAYLNASMETGFPNPIDDALRASPVPGASGWAKTDEVPYDFVRKRLSVAATDGRRRLLITKGAVADVLEACTLAESAAGQLVPIADARAAIAARFEGLSRGGLRCLALAYRELPTEGVARRDDERDLTFLGLLALADPLKPSARASLGELEKLGIRVKLITGDNRHVAARLAADAGLDASRVCTGSEVRRLSEAALVSVASRIDVFAEVEPNQKERIILALKAGGWAVGYLGDGINDAAALHAADVGISVESATDVTKQAADIVLLEKDLGVLGRGVREGRRAFANTLKYVFITASANFGNMFSMAGASLFAAFLPLLPKQILLVNVLSDLPAMAIATDRLDPELVERPRRWDNRGIRRFMLAFGLVSSVFDYLIFGALLLLRVPAAAFRTSWFIESVLSELLILLVIRTRRPLLGSRVGTTLLVMSIVVATATVLLPYSPFAALLGFAPLPPVLVGVIAAIVLLYGAASEVVKRVIFQRAPL
ncbi:MAG TPA: magnesium-translocating P-type ATPase [Gemmatimonadaceae bacterium]